MTETTVLSDTALPAWLRERNADIRHIEEQARIALYERGDEAAYRDLMRKKAVLLSTIADDAAARFTACPAFALARLASFASGAKAALKIGSVFYMSALLYPDEHQPGEPNNLERLIAELPERS